jgi:8-oxo-dGTP pyrophosphatase MutT (NUDIX family)
VPSFQQIAARLADHRPAEISEHDGARAAVAVVLREGRGGPEVLFIERARHEGDPWSGHMAFPGGRVDPVDADTRAAAERETLEEVGLSLASATHIGRLDDKTGNPRTASKLVISAYVYRFHEEPELSINHEVANAFWFPIEDLLDPDLHVGYDMEQYDIRMPGILVGEPDRHIVWGLTYSFLESFFVAVGEPLPERWDGGLREYARDMDRDAQGSGGAASSRKAGQPRTGRGG